MSKSLSPFQFIEARSALRCDPSVKLVLVIPKESERGALLSLLGFRFFSLRDRTLDALFELCGLSLFGGRGPLAIDVPSALSEKELQDLLSIDPPYAIAFAALPKKMPEGNFIVVDFSKEKPWDRATRWELFLQQERPKLSAKRIVSFFEPNYELLVSEIPKLSVSDNDLSLLAPIKERFGFEVAERWVFEGQIEPLELEEGTASDFFPFLGQLRYQTLTAIRLLSGEGAESLGISQKKYERLSRYPLAFEKKRHLKALKLFGELELLAKSSSFHFTLYMSQIAACLKHA